MQAIRRIIGKATDLLERPYPLSRVKFKSFGSRIVAEALDEAEMPLAFELDSGQFLLEPFLERLVGCLDYSDIETACRWWPLGKDVEVILDPHRRFGEPVITESTIPTAALAGAFKAEGSIKAVAHWYGISEKSVGDALKYEDRLRAA